MRVPLRAGDYPAADITISGTLGHSAWQIQIGELNPDKSSFYSYEDLPDDNTKFFEDGIIYNADGSIADNELYDRDIFFHGFPHASLDDALSQPSLNAFDNYLYGLPVNDYINLQRIASIRDRLNVPDWVALFVFAKLVDEDSVRSLLDDVPDFFNVYPLDWILNGLGISSHDINMFGEINKSGKREPNWVEDSFEDFCTVLQLEKEHLKFEAKNKSAIESQIGSV